MNTLRLKLSFCPQYHPRLVLVLLISGFLLAFQRGEALAQGTGSQGGIRGSVLDNEFYQAVPGAEVTIEGSGSRVISEEDGSFFINAINPGVYTLLIYRAGYTRERVPGIVINPGSVTESTVRLTAEVVELEDFIVSMEDIIDNATTMSPAALTADMQSFSTALGADFLSKIGGGGDVSGAVTRLSGTSVVDSRYVVIRGLSDRYNVVVLNGARIPSSDPNKRAVNIDIFPSNLVASIVSSKTFTPDMPGESTGGFLNVVTKSIPDKAFVNFFMETGYNTQASLNPNFLQYSGGGTGFLGTSRERALPGELAVTTKETLPLGQPTIIAPNGTVISPSEEVVRARTRGATLLSDRTMGVDTESAPMNYSMSLSAGTVLEDFMGGRLGLVGAISYAKSYELDQGQRGASTLTQNVDGSLTGQSVRLYDFVEGEEKLLAGALFSLGWEGPERDKITFTYFTNLAAEDETVFAIGEEQTFSDPNDSLGPFAGGLPVINETLYYTERKLQTFQLTGEHIFSGAQDLKVDWASAFSNSYQEEPDIRFSRYGVNVAENKYFGITNDIPGERFERIWRRLDDLNYNLALNIEVPIGTSADGKELAKIKFGGAQDFSQRDYVTENFALRAGNTTATVPSPFGPSNTRNGLTLADQITKIDLLPTDPQPDGTIVDSLFLSRTQTPPATEKYKASQNIGAFYGMATFNASEDIEVIFGGRVETTDIKINANANFDALDPLAGGLLLNDLITGEPIPLSEVLNPTLSSTDLLPAVAVSWDVREDMTIRGAVSRTIARPTFKEIAPVLARDPVTGDFFLGNVRLKRSDIVNYDVRFEWFPQPEDSVVLSAFSKVIQDPIEYINLGNVDSVFNEESATIYGFEIELGKKLTEWGPFLEDITLGFNYAKMISLVELTDFSRNAREGVGLSSNRALQGQPDYTMNFNMIYDNEDMGFTVGAFLNLTGELVYQVGGVSGSSLAPDVTQETFTRLDFNISKEIFDDWFLGVRIGNFLNSERRRDHRINGKSIGPFEFVREGTLYAISLSKKW